MAILATLIAKILVKLIALCSSIAFQGVFEFSSTPPRENHLGLWVIAVPAIGGLIVGFMARFGSAAIRGHGIPEAMEQVLTNGSKIAPRITLLKPISSAIAIGSGGPFGAEGPIIATGGALGSLIGQLIHVTADERKTLLACGAAAGMTAIFGSPVSAVLLAVELLLFELRPRTLIPVALACASAAAVRPLLFESGAVFAMPHVAVPTSPAVAFYVVLGALIGLLAVGVTRLVYGIEDAFEHIPIHWMYWPAIGGLFVGLVGYFAPRTLGVGYDNIASFLNGQLGLTALLVLAIAKLASWSVALGSGTSGGTLAPLFTIGGCTASALGMWFAHQFPFLGIDPRVAGLVGMAAIFSGASRALLASIVFAFETTQQPMGLVPLLGGCTAAYFVSGLLMKQTIMTEKIARRGVFVPGEVAGDYLARMRVGAFAAAPVVKLSAMETLGNVRDWIASRAEGADHQGYPVVDRDENLVGVVTRRDLLNAVAADDSAIGDLIRRPPAVVYDDLSLRDAADHMVAERVGRLPVVLRTDPRKVVGMITRSDLLNAHGPRLLEESHRERHLSILTSKPAVSENV
jgi:H+/Cl- antiporter ClcA